VARDRQRSKRRRQRPAGASGGTGAVPARDAARDDAAADDSVLGQGTPAPDPLKGAMPDVEQARIAEAGSGRGPSGDVPDEDSVEYLPAPDEVEGDAPRRTRGELDPAVEEEREAARSTRQRGRVLAFLGHCVDELRRVQWPDRRQVGQATAVVLGFVVLAGGYLGLMDAIWKPLVNAIL
jgi:preprotein translocase SecE subunit